MPSFQIRRDLAAIRFVRVSCALPEVSYCAGGAGFSLSSALAKCRAETIERSFELLELRRLGIKPDGIAAHPEFEKALSAAFWEATEHHCVQEMIGTKTFSGKMFVNTPSFKWGIKKVSPGGWFSVISANLKGVDFVVTSAKRSIVAALLKVWEEYRNPISADVTPLVLRRYTRAMQDLGSAGGSALNFSSHAGSLVAPQLADYTVHRTFLKDHHIVYLTLNCNKKENIKL